MSGTDVNGVGCPKHKNYRGLKKTKRDCPQCKKVYAKAQSKLRDNKPYRSIVSPSERVSCFQMLSELSCYQLFGKLPPGFWRKGSGVPQKVRDHYNKTYKALIVWRKKRIKARDWNPVQAVDTVFYYLFLREMSVTEKKIRSTKIEDRTENRPKDRSNPVEDFGDSSSRTRKKSKFQALLDIGGDNGQEEEEKENDQQEV